MRVLFDEALKIIAAELVQIAVTIFIVEISFK
jgi:hypothetical protein